MKASCKNFKELKGYIDNDNSSKVLKSTGNNSVSNFEDVVDAFIGAQREAEEAKYSNDKTESDYKDVKKISITPQRKVQEVKHISDAERRYIWLSKGG
jgi:hypothetical protein